MKNLKDIYENWWIRNARKNIYSKANEEMKLWEHVLERVWEVEHQDMVFAIYNAGDYTKIYLREFQSKLDMNTGKHGRSLLLGLSIRYELFDDGSTKYYLTRKA